MGRRTRGLVFTVACGLTALAAGIAPAANRTHFVGQGDNKLDIYFDVKVHQGQATVYPIGWKHLECAGMRFNGTMSQPLYADTDGGFKTDQPQPTSGPVDGPPYLVTMKGKLTSDFQKASGTLRVKGGQPSFNCDTGKVHWKAHVH